MGVGLRTDALHRRRNDDSLSQNSLRRFRNLLSGSPLNVVLPPFFSRNHPPDRASDLLYTMNMPTKPSSSFLKRNGPTALSIGALCLAATSFAGCVTEEAYHRPRRTTVVVAEAPPPPPARVIVAEAPREREVIVIHEAPPPPRHEVIIERERPSRDHIWIKGYWVWRGGHHVWVDGHWERPPRPHAVWIEPRWEVRGGGHVFIEGYWK